MVFGTIGWIVVGFIAGVLVEWITPGADAGDMVVTILIGIAGGVIGGWVAMKVGLGDRSLGNILIATASANILLIVHRFTTPRPV